MIDINEMIQKEIENGYGDANAQAKVCQDLILKAISMSMKEYLSDPILLLNVIRKEKSLATS